MNESKISVMNKSNINIMEKVTDIIIYFIVTLASLTCLLPFLHVAVLSISSNQAVISRKVFLWPVGFNLDAYIYVFNDKSMIRSLLVTVITTLLFTVLGMFLTVCCAYPLTKKRLKGRDILSVFFLLTMYFSAGIIPDYILVYSLGLVNTIWSMILPWAFSAYNMIILKSFIQTSIPESLEESAFLDGCSDIGILIKIVLPLCKPVLATLCLFYAVGRWNAFQDALYYITKQELYPLQLKLNMLVSSVSDTQSISQEIQISTMLAPEVIKVACIIFATLPIVIVYPFLQKYFVKGIMLGAVKG